MYKVYGKPSCTFCLRAKKLLERKGVEFEYIDIQQDAWGYEVVVSSGQRTVPVIYQDEKLVGGFEELNKKLVA